MNRLIIILAAIFALFIQSPAIAGESSGDPGKAAEQFYAEKDTRAWVSKSDLVTKNFKKSYARQMAAESVEVDPVLQAQDTPTSKFKAVKATINSEESKATVILAAKYSDETDRLTVNMVRQNGVWKVDSVSAAK